MKKQYSISSTLVFILTAVFVSAIFIVVSYSYIEAEHKIQESFNRENIAAENLFNTSSQYIHGGLKLWASAYNSDLSNNMQIFLNAYNETEGHPEQLNLSHIKLQFDKDIRDKVDLYLINESGIVEYTTYPSELYYDFSSLTEFNSDLEKIRMNDSFIPDEIVRGVLPGAPLRKFVYHATSDHRYVAQMSLNVQNVSIPERTRLSYAELIANIMKQNGNLEKLHVFSSFGTVTIGISDYPEGVDANTRNSVRQVLNTKENIDIIDPKNHTITSYIFIPHFVDENPSSKYQDLVGKFVFSTREKEDQIAYTTILYILLAVFACIIAILIAWILSQRITTPINQIIQDIDQIAAGDLSRRMQPTHHPDLDRIGHAIQIMISRIKQSIQDLEASEMRYRSLYNSSADAILIIKGNRIVDANPSAQILFRSITDNTIGKIPWDLLSSLPVIESDGIETENSLTEFLKRNDEKDFTVTDPEGKEKTFNTRVHQLTIGGEAVTQVQIRDISQKHEYEEAIKRLNIALEQEVISRTRDLRETVSELDAFTYTVSHDLKSPLRAIDGFAHLIETVSTPLKPDAQMYITKIHENIRKMNDLIEDLLRFSRASRKTLQRTWIDTEPMVRDVVNELTGSGLYPDVTFDIRTLPQIYGDAALIRQVFINLLSNALKFKNPDWINTITIYSYHENDQNIFGVQDTGIGFDPEFKEKIFDVFTQLHPGSVYGGTGAGLAIVKRIITRHGGSIWAVSEIGKGTTFSFTIPGPETNGISTDHYD